MESLGVGVMRFRFSLRSLVAAPIVIGVVLVWGSWPHRTFEGFRRALRANRFELANSMVDCGEGSFPDGTTLDCSFDASSTGVCVKCGGALRRMTDPSYFVDGLIPRNRDVADLLLARRVYVVPRFDARDRSTRRFEFVVERGRITLCYR